MAFTATPEQLKFLRRAIDEYCRDGGIVDGDERLYVAEVTTSLFELGSVSPHDLRRGLEIALGRTRQRA